MPTKRRFMQLDVFSHCQMKGNPLAVVIDADGLDDTTMREFARWTNLSETTFLLPPTDPAADYRVRIFTPRQELPFAGHPSVGSAYVALEAGVVPAGKTTLIQQCTAGLLPVRVEHSNAGRAIHVQAPPARVHRIDDALRETIGHALHGVLDEAQVRVVDNGPHWLICQLRDGAAVRALQPDLTTIAAMSRQHGLIGVCAFGREHAGDAAMAVRAFCPADNIPEDPVTGSANAGIMAFLTESNDHAYGHRYRASQGREVGCDGYVDVVRDERDGSISIGGHCVISIRGELELG